MGKTLAFIVGAIVVAAILFFVLWGTDVDVVDGGELPSASVDVEGDAGELPEVEVDVEGGELPEVEDVEVSGDAGELPEVDVDVADVEVGTKDVTVEVPEVEVTTEEETVTVPTLDIDSPDAEGDAKERSPELNEGEGGADVDDDADNETDEEPENR